MKYAELRPTLVKKTVAAQGFSESAATPRYIAPFESKTSMELKPEVKATGVKIYDLLQPVSNRVTRRANGQVRKPNRLRQNGPKVHWLRALLIQRQWEKLQAEKPMLTYDEAYQL